MIWQLPYQKYKGETMAEITQLEEISESEIIEALSNIQSPAISSVPATPVSEKPAILAEPEIQGVTTAPPIGTNLGDIASLLQQLLGGKTVEITIKVKN